MRANSQVETTLKFTENIDVRCSSKIKLKLCVSVCVFKIMKTGNTAKAVEVVTGERAERWAVLTSE